MRVGSSCCAATSRGCSCPSGRVVSAFESQRRQSTKWRRCVCPLSNEAMPHFAHACRTQLSFQLSSWCDKPVVRDMQVLQKTGNDESTAVPRALGVKLASAAQRNMRRAMLALEACKSQQGVLTEV